MLSTTKKLSFYVKFNCELLKKFVVFSVKKMGSNTILVDSFKASLIDDVYQHKLRNQRQVSFILFNIRCVALKTFSVIYTKHVLEDVMLSIPKTMGLMKYTTLSSLANAWTVHFLAMLKKCFIIKVSFIYKLSVYIKKKIDTRAFTFLRSVWFCTNLKFICIIEFKVIVETCHRK